MKNTRPPKTANRILKWIANRESNYAILGDFEEEFYEIAETEGAVKAAYWYWKLVLISFPSFVINLFVWSFAMFKSFLKIAYRNLLKNKLSSVINILGLSTAVSCAIFAYLFISWQYNMDTFHENAESIFMVENIAVENNKEQLRGDSPVPLAPWLISDFPQVKRAVRADYYNGKVIVEDKEFDEYVVFVDDGFLDMFTFPLKQGIKESLTDKNGIFISEKYAEKYFGTNDPLGKEITIRYKNKVTETYLVKGVLENFPMNASFSFDIITLFENNPYLSSEDIVNWSVSTSATFVQLNDPEDITNIAGSLESYINAQNEANQTLQIKEFIFEPLLELSLNQYRVSPSIIGGGHPVGRIALTVLSILILSLACFNYINISIASASRRLKEIGLRKVVGSSKTQMVTQFISENILLSLMALAGGILISEFYMIPAFAAISGGELIFSMNYLDDFGLLLFFAGIVFLTGIGAGAYPAFYISAFQPVNIIRGTQRLKGRSKFTRFSITFQFFFSMVTVLLCVAVVQNNNYQMSIDWGYDPENIINIPVDSKGTFESLSNAITGNPEILSAAGAVNPVGLTSVKNTNVRIEGEDFKIGRFDVGDKYFELMGLNLKEGRKLSSEFVTDYSSSIIVNETFVKSRGWDEAVNRQILIENEPFTIIGIVEDFHFRPFTSAIEPVLLKLVHVDELKYLSVKVSVGAEAEMEGFLKETWEKQVPHMPFESFRQSSIFDEYHWTNKNDSKIFIFIAFLALTISWEFAVILLIATVLAVPTAYTLITAMLDTFFRYRMPLGITLFLISFAIIIFTAFVSVFAHVYRAAAANPVNGLRNE
jgi:ABC-type antimicrobial peptide transport system permease subunit